MLKSANEGGADKNLLLAWRYNECIQTQEDLKNKQQEGVHLMSDFKNKPCDYQFDLSHVMGTAISGHNLPIQKDKYFHIVDEEFISLNELWTSICTQYQDKLESAEDQSFFRFFIPNFLNFDLYEDDKDIAIENSERNVVKFLRNLRSLVKTMN